ncbi:DUF4861 family protein [Zobellia galactanivorans]|uniref:DUF4861 family protein n=1 Tax=Zobellia galactanivorans (strain DSM 12802 / CCUG 47099 / CIP 106680 / NCIMB 13871 / Dsij) TaxID=63186 RepID=UPI001C077E38|nr:DUF4861 family protein [Zobellia galactanivorans]MBU3028413.1 DUF4861 domain-containing protein [Zobellia galactanivorans]MDO6809947.1 DUF4861 family protein [Zobellia galactanivorans]
MIRSTRNLSLLLLLFLGISCSEREPSYEILVMNDTDIPRTREIVEVWLKDLPEQKEIGKYTLTDESGKPRQLQYVDKDSDDIDDYLIFMTNINAREKRAFTLSRNKGFTEKADSSLTTYCRIVPERMDDFAWENDKVAFRSYGPKCQELFEEGNASGLISSGIDCWTKRVEYPIINKWYKNDKKGKSYHEDHGEGLDNYHVGTTRGCGGTALVYKGKTILSKNFVNWKILANGPIRSIFELEYAPIMVGGDPINETKRITIDLGTQLYQCEVFYKSQETMINEMFMGLALHDGKGKVNSSMGEGWVSYWEPMGDSYLGTAVLTNPDNISKVSLKSIIHEDESKNNVGIHSRILNNTVKYWSGFGWKKSGDFDTPEDWDNYVKKEAAKKRNPIKIKISSK